MTNRDKWDTVVTSGTLAGSFLLAILAVCWVISMLAASLHEWSLTR